MQHWFRSRPFLSLGLSSFGLLGLLLALEWPSNSGLFRGIATLWHLIGFGPHLVANLLARWVPGLPRWFDAVLVVLLGMLPYLAADILLAHARRIRAGRASAIRRA